MKRNIDKIKMLTEENEKLKYELGRYKKAVETREEINRSLNEDFKGMSQIVEMYNAFFASIATRSGGTIKIPIGDVAKYLSPSSNQYLKSTKDEHEQLYIIKVEEKETS